MYKKIILVLFVLLIGIIITDYFCNFFMPFTKYVLSLIILLIGILKYPTYFKFNTKVDFMILPILAVVVFNLANLFYLKNYSLKIDYINILMGTFGVIQSFVYKDNK